MPVIPFIGSSYRVRSVNFDAQRSINLYPIKSETGDSKAVSALVGTPGLEVYATAPSNGSRGARAVNNRAFQVIGDTLYEVTGGGGLNYRGTLNTSSGFVSMSDNGVQVVMVDGPDGYILTLATNAFARITSDGWMGADTVTFVDGYFLFNKPDTGIYYITALYDGFDINALDFASAEGSPDNLVGVMAVHKEVWLFGVNSVEVVFDSGDPDFPFSRIQGAFMQYGCASAAAIATNANTVLWVGRDEQGSGIVWMASGYQPQRVSTFAVEYAIQQYDLSTASAYVYQEDGHYFYVLNFSQATWVYDIGMNEWHERAFWNKDTGLFERHRAQTHMYAFNRHLVGDYQNGNIYNASLDIFNDFGEELRAQRTSPHIADDLEYIYFTKFQLDMQTGIGLSGSAPSQDIDPQIMLRWSDDGGHTWSSDHWVSAGKMGEYARRAIWRRLGRSRDRIWQVTFTANCKRYWIAAHADVEKGTN